MAARIMASIDPARSLDLTGNPTWRGLQIIDTVAGGPDDDTGIAEFRATYLVRGAGVGVQQERSRFVHEGSRWYLWGAISLLSPVTCADRQLMAIGNDDHPCLSACST